MCYLSLSTGGSPLRQAISEFVNVCQLCADQPAGHGIRSWDVISCQGCQGAMSHLHLDTPATRCELVVRNELSKGICRILECCVALTLAALASQVGPKSLLQSRRII